MTDNEIIKALENEVKSTEYVDSDYCDGVYLTLIKSAIDLINRQQAQLADERAKIEICAETISRQDAEIERLKECPKCIYEYDGKTTEYCVQGPCSNFKVVRCKDCEHYKKINYDDINQNTCEITTKRQQPDDYCSYGERKCKQ